MAARRSPPQGFQGLEVINSPQNTSSTAVSGQWPSPPPPPVQYYDAPEVVPFQEKIYVGSSPDTKPLPGAPSAFSPSEFSSSTPGLKGVSVGGGDLEVIGPQKTWWKRKRVWLTGLIVGILILGLVVGLAVGLLMARNGSTSNNTASDGESNDSGNGSSGGASNTTSPCQAADGGICPDILSHVRYRDQSYVFARTQDGTIKYITGDGKTWESEWTDLGQPRGNIVSPPVSVAWTPEGEAPRLDVLVLSSSERSVYGTNLQGDDSDSSDWTAEWTQFGGRAASQPAVCSGYAARMDMWVRDRATNNITHNWWLDNLDDPAFFALGDADWQTQNPGLGPVTSAPAVVCRNSNDMHDVVYYDRDARPPVMRHQHFHQDQQHWAEPGEFEADPSDQGVTFVGEPRAFAWAQDTEHLDIFGVRASANDDEDDDNSLFHVAYSTTDDRYTDLRGLGGNITSVPTAVSLAKDAIDAIALGRDGRLKRIHYNGDTWVDDWEDLGIETQSAPLAVNVDGAVTIFTVGENGALTVATADDLTDAASWADKLSVKTWDDAGLSLEFFVQED